MPPDGTSTSQRWSDPRTYLKPLDEVISCVVLDLRNLEQHLESENLGYRSTSMEIC